MGGKNKKSTGKRRGFAAGKGRRSRGQEGSRNERQFFLLFCEGKETEPNYFRAMAHELPSKLVRVEIDPQDGYNTISLVGYAQEKVKGLRRQNPTFSFDVWLVFDKDDFPADRFDNAIMQAHKNGFEVAWSNQCFELWYLLHFAYMDVDLNRDQYINKIEKTLGEKYDKSSVDIYRVLKEHSANSQKQAIKNADKLLKFHGDIAPAKCRPGTTVHKLVAKLAKYRLEPGG